MELAITAIIVIVANAAISLMITIYIKKFCEISCIVGNLFLTVMILFFRGMITCLREMQNKEVSTCSRKFTERRNAWKKSTKRITHLPVEPSKDCFTFSFFSHFLVVNPWVGRTYVGSLSSDLCYITYNKSRPWIQINVSDLFL